MENKFYENIFHEKRIVKYLFQNGLSSRSSNVASKLQRAEVKPIEIKVWG